MLEEDKYQALLELTACELSRSVDRHMPSHDYQRYFKWGLSSHNVHHDNWLKLTGISQLIHLTLKLLNHSETSDYWTDLMSASVAMNTYQIYEIVSDNLAIGLVRSEAKNEDRREVLLLFNDAILSRLAGVEISTSDLLSSHYDHIKTISTFEQSLSFQKHHEMAQLYLSVYPYSTLADLEFSTWPLLIANIEACLELANISDQFLVGPIVRQGLQKRYQAVNDLIRHVPQNFNQQITTSADAILVVPTLAYYIGVLCEKIVPQSQFYKIIDDHSLQDALQSAAVLVRLLNDLGTLITLSSEERSALTTQLGRCAQAGVYPTLSTLILETSEQFGTAFTRVHKDAQFGEFNLALNDLGHAEPTLSTLSQFEVLLNDLCSVYAFYKDQLTQQSHHISDVVGNELISSIVWHFVTFHEALYSKPHTETTGEYAV